MNEELKKKLLAGLLAKGLPKELLAFITVTEESQVEGVLDKLEKLHKTKDEEPKSLDDFLKENPNAKSEFDRRVTKALNTQKRKKSKSKKSEEIDDPEEDEEDETILLLKELQKEVIELKSSNSKNSKLSEAEKAWQDSELPKEIKEDDYFFKTFINVESETSIEDQIKTAIEKTTGFKQSIIDTNVGSKGFPNLVNDSEPTDDEISEYIN
ncbi:conserved protein of unknown function [Tenacibaculum sp. 190524A02b]|uniref:hypothetical protein n=1 Tax=Tenacibaculum vairaonense TaxID=3137860 RepID=UPI0032B0F23C